METMVVSKAKLKFLTIFFKAWYLEWVNIRMNTGTEVSCPMGKWLDNGKNAMGPGIQTAECKNLGEYWC